MEINYKMAKKVMDMFDQYPQDFWNDLSKLFYEDCFGNRRLFIVMFTEILRVTYSNKTEEEIRAELTKDNRVPINESEVDELVDHMDFLLDQIEAIEIVANLMIDRLEIDSGKMEINVE